jgi:cytosol alanyl aminopeptidase
MRLSLVTLTLILCGQWMNAATSPNPPALRLDPSVSPTGYRASLVITPGKPTFDADMTIQLRVGKANDQLWLNAEALQILSATVSAGGQQFTPQIVTKPNGLVGFLLEKELKAGTATLQIRYTGSISDKPGMGLSHSVRNKEDYVATHFEPIAARKVFPCFDEPGFKVPWQVTIDAPVGEMVISNTSPVSDTVHEDRHRVVFGQTKPLPSYLIAFTIGSYEAIDLGKIGRNKVPARLIVPKNETPRAAFAAKMIPLIMDKLEAYFDIDYPYEKLDHVAVPNYPEGSAMEDAGSIMYDDAIILCAPDNLTHERSQRILDVVVHETAHQWFGDLVTMKWWDDTWLNEGFAQWIEWKIEGQFGEEWRTVSDKVNDLSRLLGQDVLPAAHPIRQKIVSGSEIETTFDDITYFKTAHVLAMMEHYVGEVRFTGAVRSYLRAHEFGNATSEDFLGEFAKVDPQLSVAFSQFLNRTGVPQITVGLDCGADVPIAHVSQQTFEPVGTTRGAEETWTFPICLSYPGENGVQSSCSVASKRQFDIRLPTHRCPEWLLANQQETGYYVSRYDEPTFEKLVANLRALSPLERAYTISQTRFLLTKGLEKPSHVTKLIRGFGEPSTVSDLASLVALASMLSRWESSPESSQMLADYFSRTFGQTGRRLGWTPAAGSSSTERHDHFGAIGGIALYGKDAELIAKAKELATDWLRDKHSIPPDVAPVVVVLSGAFADLDFYNLLLHSAREEKDSVNKRLMLDALAFVQRPDLISRNFVLFTTGEFPLNDSIGLLQTPSYSPTLEIRRMSLDFVSGHTEEVRSLFPRPLGRDYSQVVSYLAYGCTESERALAERVLKPILEPEDGGKQRLSERLDWIHLCDAGVQATKADFLPAIR